jgi:hypothetical protein
MRMLVACQYFVFLGIGVLNRILNALRAKLFTAGSVKRVLNWSITPLFCTIVLLIVVLDKLQSYLS